MFFLHVCSRYKLPCSLRCSSRYAEVPLGIKFHPYWLTLPSATLKNNGGLETNMLFIHIVIKFLSVDMLTTDWLYSLIRLRIVHGFKSCVSLTFISILSAERRLSFIMPDKQFQFKPLNSAGSDSHKLAAVNSRTCFASRCSFPQSQRDRDVHAIGRQ